MSSARGPDRDLQSFPEGTVLANERFGELRYLMAATSRSSTTVHLPGARGAHHGYSHQRCSIRLQDRSIEAIRSRAGRDHHDQHEGIQGLRQIEPIIDPVGSIDRLECLEFALALMSRWR